MKWWKCKIEKKRLYLERNQNKLFICLFVCLFVWLLYIELISKIEWKNVDFGLGSGITIKITKKNT